MRKSFAVFCFLAMPNFAMAEQHTKIVGNWITTKDVDAMDDSTKIIALTTDAGKNYAFGVRCFNKDLSYMIVATDKSENGFDDGSMYEVKLRPDQGNISTFKGIGDDNHSLLVEPSADIFKTVLNATTKFAIRITNAKESQQRDLVFNVGSSKAALTPIQAQCEVK